MIIWLPPRRIVGVEVIAVFQNAIVDTDATRKYPTFVSEFVLDDVLLRPDIIDINCE